MSAKKEEQEVISPADEVAVRTVVECSVVSLLEQGVSFYFNEETGEVDCVDDNDPKKGRQILWSKMLSKEEISDCEKLFERYKGEKHWEYRYADYLKQEAFWDMFLKTI